MTSTFEPGTTTSTTIGVGLRVSGAGPEVHRPRVPGPRPAVAAVRRAVDRNRSTLAVLGHAGLLGLLLHLRYGYSAGTGDHLVLSLQGLQWAHPSSFLVHDWFVAAAPQPHVLFDGATWLGAALGGLGATYLLWWVAGLLVAGWAALVLARQWFPHALVRACLATAVLIALGPTVALGTSSPALAQALPHQLGGFLAVAAVGLLVAGRARAAAVTTVLTAAVHVQLGAVLVVIVALVTAGEVIRRRRRPAPELPLGAAVAAVLVVTVLLLRPVASDGAAFTEICREVIPYHCDPVTWPAGQLWSGLCVVAAALATAGLVAAGTRGGSLRRWAWVCGVALPALGVVVGVLVARWQVPVIGALAQSTNVFRLAAPLLPVGAWGLLLPWSRAPRGVRRAGAVALPVLGSGWLLPAGGSALLAGRGGLVTAVLAVAAAAALPAALRPRGRLGRLVAGTAVAAVAGPLVAGWSAGALTARAFDPEFVPDAAQRRLGAAVADAVPPGAVVLAPPSTGQLRLTSGRSVVVDCKAVPYGGAAWRSYRERLTALGGRAACGERGAAFGRVPAADLQAAAVRFGARYLMLSAGDPRVGQLRARGWAVVLPPDPQTGQLWLLAEPGAVAVAG